MMNRIICIEGNIGSGKSTLLAHLEKLYTGNKQVVFLKEPVDDWETIKDGNGTTMLQKFYSDQTKYSFPFQMMAFISRLSVLKKTMQEHKSAVIISERSLFTDKFVFAKMLFDDNKIEDVNYQIYLKWFDEFANDFLVQNVIYVKTDPTICHDRICKRSRTGEENIKLEYLTSCHEYHEDFITNHMKCDQIILDGNIDIFENKDALEVWTNQIQYLILSSLSH